MYQYSHAPRTHGLQLPIDTGLLSPLDYYIPTICRLYIYYISTISLMDESEGLKNTTVKIKIRAKIKKYGS